MSLDLPSYANAKLAIDDGLPEDYHLIRLYYSPYSGWFYRRRLKMIDKMLPKEQVERILDVGTGSGIFIKSLLHHAKHVSGIDIHKTYRGVTRMLQAEGVDLNRVELKHGGITEIPYPDAAFDVVTCISVLEHFPDATAGLQEIKRVLKPNGWLVAGFPARNILTTTLFALLGYRTEAIHPGTHESILTNMRQVFNLESVIFFPHQWLKMYVVCCSKKNDIS